MATYFGFATIDASPTLMRPYQFNIPAVRLDIDDVSLTVRVPGWLRIVYLASTRGFTVPLTDVKSFEQDGCAVVLRFTGREPIWFCPFFLSGSLSDLMAMLHSRGLAFQPGRSMSIMGLCSKWLPPAA